MPALDLGSIIAHPREFLGNQFVYAVMTSRARGLSVGVNMNPDQLCNFNCPYCEVKRETREGPRKRLDLGVLRQELLHVIALARGRRLRELQQFAQVPEELLDLKEVALSGDGEPSLAENLDEVVAEVIHIRGLMGPFKIVLITNGAGLHLPGVQRGLEQLAPEDEVWIKLDAGTEAFMRRINGPGASMEAVLENITALGRRRPVVIQSLFCLLEGEPPAEGEIAAYVQRLADLKAAGARIDLVQIYSISRAPAQPGCRHLPLSRLSQIARRVRAVTGLRAEVF